MFIKANGNLINADYIQKVIINWNEEDTKGSIVFIDKDRKTLDEVNYVDKEEFDKHVKYLKDILTYELDIISELEDIKSALDSMAMAL